jgi:CBS domain-containing protein
VDTARDFSGGNIVKIRDLMTRDPEVVRPDAALVEAAEKMRDLNVGVIPVCDGRRLVGMLTDRDITVRGTADGVDPNRAKVRDFMTPEIHYCFADQDVEDATKIMEEKQIRRLPILDRDMSLVGIVSLGDIAVDADSDQVKADALKEISEPSRPER